MPQSTLKEKYANLRRVDIRCGNPFKGIKKFALFYQDGQVEIKSNAVPEQKERYPQKLCLPKELSKLQTDLLALQVENWQDRYVVVSSLDYDEWQVSFLFSDGEELFYQGVNASSAQLG